MIRARIARTIELAEDRRIIRATERDELTGLYTSEYFYSYCEQFDKVYPETDMDSVCIEVDRFHILNERFGKAKGDEVLKSIAECLRKNFSPIDWKSL